MAPTTRALTLPPDRSPAVARAAHSPRQRRLPGLRRLAYPLAAVCAAVALAACGGSSSSTTTGGSGGSASGPPTAGGSLTVLEAAGYSGDWPAGLDPATNTNGAADQSQMNAIFGDLFQLDPNGQVVGDIATGSKFENGGKTVLIYVRRGVTFSDGTPLNASAVAYNFKRDLASPCTCRPEWLVSSITTPDPYTVRVDLKVPDGAFIDQLLSSNAEWMASPTALQKLGEQAFKIKPVGAGPFEVVSDTLSNQLVLKKNPHYWQPGRPYLNQLVFKSIANDESALEAMQSGAAQAYEGATVPSIVQSFRGAEFQVTKEPSTSPYNIQLNTASPPFNNKQARLAIYYATDASLIDQKLFGDQEPVVQSFLTPQGLFYSGPTVPGYPTYDPAKARAIVRSLGGLSVDLFTTAATSINQDFIEALQTMWKQVGINTTIHLYSLAGVIQQFVSHHWQAALQTAGAWDPASGVGVAFRFSSLSPFSGVHDPKLDALLNQAQAAVNPATRKALYRQTAEYIAQQAYSPFLFPLANYDIAARGVGGPGLTTPIPVQVVNSTILWQDVYRRS